MLHLVWIASRREFFQEGENHRKYCVVRRPFFIILERNNEYNRQCYLIIWYYFSFFFRGSSLRVKVEGEQLIHKILQSLCLFVFFFIFTLCSSWDYSRTWVLDKADYHRNLCCYAASGKPLISVTGVTDYILFLGKSFDQFFWL